MKSKFASAAILPVALMMIVAPFAVGQKMAKATKMVSAMDKTFMNNSGHADAAEMAMAMMAKKKSKNPEVLAYADMMIKEHKMMHSELKALAAQRETMVPDAPNAKQKAVGMKLMKLNGMAFDKAYIMANVAGHKEAYANATKASKMASDVAVRDYFKKGAPKIKMHLDAAVKDQQAMMAGKPMTAMSGMKHGM
ncbi:DUF4142 domain-containing protein [bacterium]|nr:MAG: DUF4142 domain-containing protein [bacterium]